MNTRNYVYLPGGDPHEAFTRAANSILRRAGPYMGKYNLLFRTNAKPFQSIARGLSEALGVSIQPENLFFGHGVKEAMQFSARFIDWLCLQVQNRFREAGYKAPKFKFLVKTPSYKRIVEQFEGYKNFECQYVSSFDRWDMYENGKFNHENFMDNLLEDHFPRDDIKPALPFEYIIGYLDINPCNPTGHVRGLAETIETARVLDLIRGLNQSYLRRAIPRITWNREPFVLVEDLIYRGLEFDGKKATSFRELGEHWQSVTHTAFGVSKHGLVGMRGSVTVAPRLDVNTMNREFREQNSDISPFSVLACEYMFGDDPRDKGSRDKYLKTITREYERNVLLAMAIIGGNAHDFLSASEYDTATQWLTKFGKLPEVEAHELLESGIKGIKTIGMPRAGFFIMLEYDDLIYFAEDESDWQSKPIIKFIRQVADRRFSMYLGDAEYLGLNDEFDAVTRFTVATTPASLVERLMRLRELSDFMFSLGPLNTHRLPDPSGPYTIDFGRSKLSLNCVEQVQIPQINMGTEPVEDIEDEDDTEIVQCAENAADAESSIRSIANALFTKIESLTTGFGSTFVSASEIERSKILISQLAKYDELKTFENIILVLEYVLETNKAMLVISDHDFRKIYAPLTSDAMTAVVEHLKNKTQYGNESDNGVLFRVLCSAFWELEGKVSEGAEAKANYYLEIMPRVSDRDVADFFNVDLTVKRKGKTGGVRPSIAAKFKQALKERMANCEAAQNNFETLASLTTFQNFHTLPLAIRHYYSIARMAERFKVTDYPGEEIFRKISDSDMENYRRKRNVLSSGNKKGDNIGCNL